MSSKISTIIAMKQESQNKETKYIEVKKMKEIIIDESYVKTVLTHFIERFSSPTGCKNSCYEVKFNTNEQGVTVCRVEVKINPFFSLYGSARSKNAKDAFEKVVGRLQQCLIPKQTIERACA